MILTHCARNTINKANISDVRPNWHANNSFDSSYTYCVSLSTSKPFRLANVIKKKPNIENRTNLLSPPTKRKQLMIIFIELTGLRLLH